MDLKFNLRKLESKDAEYMIEWMHDAIVTENLKQNFKEKTIDDCLKFIENASINKENIHYAIINENDEYLGTVSLKNIDFCNKIAEFAITIRRKAMGNGCSSYAIKEIIKRGFDEHKLKYIYWYVSKENKRALKFYDKNNYKRVDFKTIFHLCSNIEDENYIWYLVKNRNC